MTKIAEVSEATGRLAELVRQVAAGTEVVLTEDHKPVARIVAASESEVPRGIVLHIPSLRGHRVLTPSVAQSELADEMFGRQ